MEKGRFHLKPKWWRKVKRAYGELKEDTNNFTTKKNIDLEDVQTDRHKFIALRLISGRNIEETAPSIDLPFQTLLKWESGKARTPLPPNTAEKMVLRCDFQDFRGHGPTNPFISRFFKECSLLDMKKDYVRGKRLLLALQFTAALFFVSFLLGAISDTLEILVPFMSVVVALSMFSLFGALAFLLVFGSMNPLLKGSIGEELCYAKRFILSGDTRVREWGRKLLASAAKSVNRRAREISEPEGVSVLYEGVADSISSKLVPHTESFDKLGKREKELFINTLRRWAEHFFSPSLESTISLQKAFADLFLEFPAKLPEVRKTKRVAESIERLDRRLYYENPTGGIVIDSFVILCAAFDIVFLSWIPLRFDATTAVPLFAAISIVLSTLRVAHLKSR